MNETIIGFTGTRKGMTIKQRESALHILNRWKAYCKDQGDTLIGLHGDCLGADAEFDALCVGLGIETRCRPCTLDNQRAHTKATIIAEPEPPLDRNKKIVDDSFTMLAAPAEDLEQQRGGTWSTIRYARKTSKTIGVMSVLGGLLNTPTRNR